ncbi:MAG TPA: hypothetical protein VMF69_13140 [Gemmataceae bacterium]|nr:hypothetical protein [Gemmataceae bacterium]
MVGWFPARQNFKAKQSNRAELWEKLLARKALMERSMLLLARDEDVHDDIIRVLRRGEQLSPKKEINTSADENSYDEKSNNELPIR